MPPRRGPKPLPRLWRLELGDLIVQEVRRHLMAEVFRRVDATAAEERRKDLLAELLDKHGFPPMHSDWRDYLGEAHRTGRHSQRELELLGRIALQATRDAYLDGAPATRYGGRRQHRDKRTQRYAKTNFAAPTRMHFVPMPKRVARFVDDEADLVGLIPCPAGRAPGKTMTEAVYNRIRARFSPVLEQQGYRSPRLSDATLSELKSLAGEDGRALAMERLLDPDTPSLTRLADKYWQRV